MFVFTAVDIETWICLTFSFVSVPEISFFTTAPIFTVKQCYAASVGMLAAIGRETWICHTLLERGIPVKPFVATIFTG